MPVYFNKGSDHRATSQTVDDHGVNCAQFTRKTCMHLYFKKYGATRTNKPKLSISHVLNKAIPDGKLLSFFHCRKTFVSCCKLFARNRGLQSFREIAFAGLLKKAGSLDWLETSSPIESLLPPLLSASLQAKSAMLRLLSCGVSCSIKKPF